jgi:MurNAc alpha-1-phosphate uridylyltransferase
VGGKPLILWHIERLVRAGITDLVINHAHLGKQIEQALGDGGRFGASIRYSDEGTALETAGGIAFAAHLLGDDVFAVVNGDVYCDFDFTHLPAHAAALSHSDDMAHLVLVDNPEHNLKGDFGLQDARITDTHPKLTFSGIGLYKPQLFAHIERGAKAPLAPLLREQIAAGKVSGEHHRGAWVDVGTPRRLQALDLQLRAAHV